MAVKKVGKVHVVPWLSEKRPHLTIVGGWSSLNINCEQASGEKMPDFPKKPKEQIERIKTILSKKQIKECPKCLREFPEKSDKCSSCSDGFLKPTKLVPKEVEVEKEDKELIPNTEALTKYEAECIEKSNEVMAKLANKIIPIHRLEKAKNAVLYNGCAYSFDRSDYSDEERLLQIMDLEDDERKKFERLRNKFSKAEEEEKQGKRPAIPEDVRIAVWRRDEGKCSKCGSRDSLEYDHIIPISKGGSNTVRNIELLCEACNRSKSDNIQ